MTEENGATTGVETPETGAAQSAREHYRNRYSAAHPDLNLDDEEAFYGQANQNLDELEGFRESNRQLGEAFDRTPLLAGLVGQIILLPVIAWAVAWFFQPEPLFFIGFMLIACSPGGSSSNVFRCWRVATWRYRCC